VAESDLEVSHERLIFLVGWEIGGIFMLGLRETWYLGGVKQGGIRKINGA
jgi:hypothetical protein